MRDPSSGLDVPLRFRQRVPILMYHHVEPGLPDPRPLFPNSYVSRATFAQQLDALQRWGFRTMTLAAVAQVWACGDRPPRRTAVVTFDDACSCLVQHALPELTSRGMTATVFAVSSQIGGRNEWDIANGERPERLMNAAELRVLRAADIEIGSHSHTHRDLTKCDEAECRLEVATSRAMLEPIVGPVTTFCYPYGSTNVSVSQAVRAAGIDAAVSITAEHGARASDRLSLPRYIVSPGESLIELRLKVFGLYELVRRLPRLGILKRLRRQVPS